MKLRARTLRPQFFASEQVTNCTMAARLLFQGLWCLADREGRLEDRPKQIKLLIFPVDKVSIENLLRELAAAGLIVRYAAEGQNCIWIPRFVEHQPVHPHEAKSALPACNYIFSDSSASSDVITCNDKPDQQEGKGNGRDRGGDQEGESEGEPSAETIQPEDLVEAWNEVCAPAGLPKVAELTPKRRQHAWARLKEHPIKDFWEQIFANIPASPLLRGLVKTNGHQNWRATFDWLIDNELNPIKVYEGNYNRGQT